MLGFVFRFRLFVFLSVKSDFYVVDNQRTLRNSFVPENLGLVYTFRFVDDEGRKKAYIKRKMKVTTIGRHWSFHHAGRTGL